MPPATKTGTSRTCGRISCASTVSDTGPICPPASLPSITSASAPRAHEPPGQHQRRGEADQPGAAVLDRAHGGAGRDAAGQHDVADPCLQADPHQVGQLGVHGDEVHAERAVGQRLGGGDLGGQQRRAHRAAGDHAEAAGIGDGGHQGALADPAHGAAHDGDPAAEEAAAHAVRAPASGRLGPRRRRVVAAADRRSAGPGPRPGARPQASRP